MHRSSWRAARVLRGAKLGQRPPLQQQQQQQHHQPRQSDLDSGRAGLACTCAWQQRGSLTVQSRSYSTSALNDGNVATRSSKVVDVKGKGRETSAGGQAYDNHHTGGVTSSPSTVFASVEPGTAMEDEIYLENEHNLHSALDGQSQHPIRDSWRNFAKLPLDRRKALPEATLAELAAVQRRGAMASRAKRSTWRRLREIYSAWEPHAEDAGPVAAGVQHHLEHTGGSRSSERRIPAQELAATLEVVREWLATQEQVMDRKAVSDAAGLCLVIARRQACYDDPSILANAARHIAQHGNDSRLKRLADILQRHVELRPSAAHLAGLLRETCSLVISKLARRMMVRDALKLGAMCLEAGPIVSDEAVEEVAQVLEAANFTPEELSELAAVLQGRGSLQNNPTYAQWNTIIAARSNTHSAVVPGHQQVLAQGRPLENQQSKTKRLAWLKLQMHHLLEDSARYKARLKNVTISRAGRQLDAALSYTAGGQVRAIAALHLYTESLWEGVQPDETLLHLVARAKRRCGTTSVVPSDVLRRAARRVILDEEARRSLNYREKWELPRSITTLLEPKTVEAEPAQVLQGASLEQLMHLAVEVQDFELARALSQFLLQRTGSVWRPHERPAMFHKLFNAIVADALLHLRDTKHASAQRVVAFACDLYTHWQRSSGVVPDDVDTARKGQRESLPRRRPVLSMLRLLANNVYSTESFRQTWIALIRDRAVELKEEHIAMYLRAVLEVHRGSDKQDVRAAYQAYEAMRMLQVAGKHRYKHLQASVQSVWTGLLHSLRGHEQRQRLRWFGLVHEYLHGLRIDVDYGTLRDVLHAYDGGPVPHDDGSLAELAESLKEAKVAERLLSPAVLANARSRLVDQTEAQAVLQLLLSGQVAAALQSAPQVMLLFKQTKSHQQAAIFIDACCAALGGEEGTKPQMEELSAMLVNSRRHLGRIGNDLKKARSEAARLDKRAPLVAVEDVMQPSLLPVAASPAEMPLSAAPALPSEHTLEPEAAMIDAPQVETTPARNADHPAEASFLSAFFTHNGGPADLDHEPQAAHQPAAVGFCQAQSGPVAASRPENMRARDAPAQAFDEQQDDYGRSYSLASSRSSSVQSLPSLPGQAYSTLASQRQFRESFFGPRATPVASATANAAASHQEYTTLPDSLSASTTRSQASFLQELSQLPQQFADLTMEQVLAWRKRCEAEAQATRQRQELEDAAARRMALSRADASRWDGYQEVRGRGVVAVI